MADLALLALALVAVAAVIVISRRDDDGNDMRAERDLGGESPDPGGGSDVVVSGEVANPLLPEQDSTRARSGNRDEGEPEHT